MEKTLIKRVKIEITGRVQGVGFRPAVYKAAANLHLSGYVFNDTKGVTVEIQGKDENIEKFISSLKNASILPPMAEIKTLKTELIAAVENETAFVIKASDYGGTALTQVTADLAICDDCKKELNDKNDFRYRYPFINCTNCGPRYSIVKTIPYDRCSTTMSEFAMCEKCSSQYRDVNDRRFHAQPVACPKCGPKIWLADNKGKPILETADEVIAETAKMLKEGKVLAIKGIGGFHLAVDALNENAVCLLRQRKRRDHKPFALMTDSIEKIKKYAMIDDASQKFLQSPQAPIVLLKRKPDCTIAPSVAKDLGTLGFMLCYAPLHFLLFEELAKFGIDVLVMTSANLSDEPLICKNDKAVEKLGGIADAFLMHDREIFRQVDDSIAHFIADKPALLRRSRGFMPTPVIFEISSPIDIFAAGSDLKNTFCFVKQNQFICSEHIGDLEDGEVYHHYIQSIKHLQQLFEVNPKVVACDLHPGYFSTQFAKSLKDAKLIQIQHHWAHIASIMAENNITEKVIGIECDGTGYGTDGAVWGCECLIASLDNFERFGHLSYYSLPGGDKASKQAVRSVIPLLLKTYGSEFRLEKFTWLLDRIEQDRTKQKMILEQVEKSINCVQTSSLGRVFDAVAAMAGIGNYNHFEAQLPMLLESAAEPDCTLSYSHNLIKNADNTVEIDLSRMLAELIEDIKNNAFIGRISAKFHNCLANALLETAIAARQRTNINTIALSGGVFCNRYLANKLISLLQKHDFIVLFNSEVPANDGGISLGQAAIAAYKIINNRNF